MTERTDYGKPGDPSGCYFPREWRSAGAKIGHENREAVRRFFADHIGCTNVECGKALGLSVMAVGRHIASLRSEWTTSNPASLDHSGGSPLEGGEA